jgi:hypothetical protein
VAEWLKAELPPKAVARLLPLFAFKTIVSRWIAASQNPA